MNIMKSFIRRCGTLLLCLVLPYQVCAASPIVASVGPHQVGLRVIQQYDRARAFKPKVDPVTGSATQGERARPLQTLVWYPARSSPRKLAYADYVSTRQTEQQFEVTDASRVQFLAHKMKTLSDRIGVEQARAALDASSLASFNAEPVPGRFPVVIYATGRGGTADDNADLCEFLASHGYIVMASTSLGTTKKDIAYAIEDAETQARDVAFLVGYALSLDQVDPAHIAVIGWSWGGMANVFAAARDNRISAIVSLDGTREPAFTKLIDLRDLTAPWLYISRTPDTVPQISRAEIDTTFSLLNEAKFNDVFQLTMYPMRHADFLSKTLRESNDSGYDEYTKPEVAQAYGFVAQYVLNFLDAYLKQDLEGAAFLRRAPRQNGVPAHMIRLDVHEAEPLPSSQASLAGELARRGFAHAAEVYADALKRDKQFKLSEQELKGWGYSLLENGSASDAIEVLKLWVTLRPANWDAADSLAEAYEAAGDTRMATRYYKASLALNPDNGNATKRLRALASRTD